MSEYDSLSVPVETFEFVVDGYGALLRYTSDEVEVIAQGNRYTPLPGISRSSVAIATTGETADITVTVPATALIARLTSLFATPKKVTCAFRRYQRTDLNTPTESFDAIWAGSSISGGICTLKFPDAFQNALATTLPHNKTQPVCNWMFGDTNCKKDPTIFMMSSTAERCFLPNDYNGGNMKGRRFSFSAVGYTGPEYAIRLWIGGTLRAITPAYGTAGGNEVRTISQVYTNAGGIPTYHTGTYGILIINEPFTQLASNTVFQLQPGCDKGLQACANYQNVQNHGGFPYMPTENLNPFTIRLDKSRKS